jgi:hypothetical protein
MRHRADDDGVDVLLVDTGDRIEGNGLYDGSEPKGKYYFDILDKQRIDLICSGNHELYKANSSNDEFHKTVPAFKDNYLASNLDIYNPDTNELEPLAPRFKKFSTKNQGIRILAFGFLFDFTGNANNTVVTPVENTIKQDWFQKAIRDRDVDLILVFGHVVIRSKEYDAIFKAIRSVQWDTPIAFLGGHSHIRDFKVYDSKSAALESGRYFETIGFLSISGLNTPNSPKTSRSLTFARRYIDNNLYSLRHHTNTTNTTFPTQAGLNISSAIHTARKRLKLDQFRGCAPQPFYVNRAPYPSNTSIFTWLQTSVLPEQFKHSHRATQDGKKALALTNTGAMRFDIFEGPFTRDTELLVSPFTSGFRFLADVPWGVAKRVLVLLNNQGPVVAGLEEVGGGRMMLGPPEQWSQSVQDAPPSWGMDEKRSGLRTAETAQQPLLPVAVDSERDIGGSKIDLRPGYTTVDDLGDDGDDTLHSPIAFYSVPNCIQATVGFDIEDPPETVDLVYNEFLQPWILLAMKYLGQKYEENDVRVYLDGKSFTEVISEWVKENWQVEENKCR